MTAPGYARPTTEGPGDFDVLDVGVREGAGAGSTFNWRPVGSYIEAGVNWTWGLEPGKWAFELHPKHPFNDAIRQADIDRHIYQFRAARNGIPFTGRVMQRKEIFNEKGAKRYLYSGVCNKIWLQSGYGWVNNLFPPEVQVNITGKQDIRFGSPDQVMKSFVSSVFTRLDKPVYARLPVRTPSSWSLPDLNDIDSLDDLLDLLLDAGGDVVAIMARFTRLDELFKQTVERLELGVSVDAWDGRGAPPMVFAADGIADLQSIIDHNGDHFLDLSKLGDAWNDGLWSETPNRACYVFDTHEKRDNRKTQLRTDAPGQIQGWELTVNAPEATRAIVGGKSPSLVNELIEIGSNLAIAAIIAGLATIPGLGGIAGLSVTVGDLFDDIFFAYEVFVDNDLEAELGEDALPEGFADNTAAYSVDSYSVGKTYLHDKAGNKQLDITAMSGAADGRGVAFGADNGTARRYQMGDILTFWDDGNIVEKYVTGVAVTSKPGERMRESLTVGSDKRAKGIFTKLITGVQNGAATSRGFANST